MQFNTATSNGGGIYTTGSLEYIGGDISNNSVTDAAAGRGGGLYASTGAISLSSGATVKFNSAAFGGGIYAESAALEGGLYEANTATDSGGGVYIGSDMGTSLARVTLNENTATNKGGGIFADSYMNRLTFS